MAKKNDNKAKPEQATKAKVVETLYKRSEILESSHSFGEVVETVAGALNLTDKEELSRSEVQQLISKFKKKRV